MFTKIYEFFVSRSSLHHIYQHVDSESRNYRKIRDYCSFSTRFRLLLNKNLEQVHRTRASLMIKMHILEKTKVVAVLCARKCDGTFSRKRVSRNTRESLFFLTN